MYERQQASPHVGLVLFIILLLSGCATRQPTTNPTGRKYSVHEYKLSNALTLTVQPDPAIPLVTMDMWVRVGSGDEPREIAGISHYLEHMLFKGTERLAVGQYDRNVEEAGGYLNAATSTDYTHYYVTIPSAHFEKTLNDFADVLMNSSIDPVEVESERLVILEEIRRKIDNPFGYLFDETMPALYENGPYMHPVIGYSESVKAITREQLHDHYQRFYAPDNMFLSIVGDVDPDAVRGQVEEAFSGFSRRANPHREQPPPTIFRPAYDRKLAQNWNEAYFILAFPGPAGDSLETMAVSEFADTLLTGGRASRLVNALQEKKALVSSIGAYLPTYRHPAPLMIYGTCKPENLDEVRREIFVELNRLFAGGIAEQEMRRVRRQVLNGHLYSLETNAGRAQTLGYSQVMLGNNALLNEFSNRIKAVKEKDVLDFLRASMKEEFASFHVTARADAANMP